MSGSQRTALGNLKHYKTLIYGILAVIIGLLFAHYLIGDPVSDFALLYYGETTNGLITDTDQDYESNESGSHYSFIYTYNYRVKGREYIKSKSSTGKLKEEFASAELPVDVEVEFLPRSPKISRLKGSGSASLLEWIFRRLLLSLWIYGIMLFPGIFLIRQWNKELSEESKSNSI